MNYYYIHTVSYWTGNQRQDNFAKHAEKLRLLKTPEGCKNLLIVSILDDSAEAERQLINKIHSLGNSRLDVVCLITYGSDRKSVV